MTPSAVVPQGFYDKFSNCGAVASNRSHAKSNASRVGAFEVHLVQDVWQAKRLGGCSLGSPGATSHPDGSMDVFDIR